MPVARTGESDEPSTRRRGGRLLLIAGVVTALGAAGVLVLSNDLRWLRLGVVAALWAALVGAFIAARYRGQVADKDDRAADLQAVYELELEREIAARREYELQVEAEIRAEVDEQSRRDVAALRDELRTLRQTLENLLGGEVLVERYALQAQATRMRPLQEAQVKRLPAAVNGPPPEPVTEQFERVTELRPVKTGPRVVPPLPRRADRTERPAWPARDPAAKPHPVDTPDPRVTELPPTVVTQFRPASAENPAPRQVDPPAREPFRPAPAEPPLPPAQEVERFRSMAEQSLSRIERLRTRQAEPPTQGGFRPATAEHPSSQPPSGARFRPATGAHPVPGTQPWQRGAAEQPSVDRPAARRSAEPPSWDAERSGYRSAEPARRAAPPPEPPRVDEPVRTAWEERPVAPPTRPVEEPSRRAMPGAAPSRSGRHSEPPAAGGRRRRAEPEPEPPRRHARPDAEAAGRRRRAEDTPSWQELAAWDPVVKATSRAWEPSDGSHARADEGSHASGHSVADLLAQHGADSPRRRRRRED